ncbi:MAG: YicC/YloC family endoribonuclease [bacterium]
MIVSMTGYGRGIAQEGDVTIAVEGRSLNHRFCDISIKLPVPSFILEKKIRDLIKSSFHRGKIDLHLSISKSSPSSDELPLDCEVASRYYRTLCRLRTHLHLKEDITLVSIMPFIRDIMGTQEQDFNIEALGSLIEEALRKAIDSIKEMRVSEGKSLYEDIKGRVDYVDTIIREIQERAPQLLEELRKQLSNRIAEHFPDISLDPGRLEQELALAAEKIDITEELIRLDSHLNQMKEFLLFDGPIGRKLDFLLQEIHREVNTLGYKSNDIEISRKVVEVKSELEKIREQVQNIE